jgi:histidyl-tRNA synthetase
MEINVKDLPGSLGGGGRYDNLVGMFAGQDIPACGFSLGLERIIVVMTERGLFPPLLDTGPADIMVTIWDETSIDESLRLASELRASGLRVLFYPEVRKPAKQLFYADNRKIRFRIIVGPDEIQSGNFKVRDKQRGEETMPRAEIAATLMNRLHEDAETLEARNKGFQAIVEGE